MLNGVSQRLRYTYNEELNMNPNPKRGLALVSTLALALLTGPAFAAGSLVKVSLWDKGAQSMAMAAKGPMMGMAMGEAGGKMPMAPMGIKVSTHDVKAGAVTFTVHNASTQLVHEMVLSPVKDAATALPYDKNGQKVDEDAAGHLGEVAELAPGKGGSLTVDLKPGRYILYCNIPDHYVLGMWTLINVK